MKENHIGITIGKEKGEYKKGDREERHTGKENQESGYRCKTTKIWCGKGRMYFTVYSIGTVDNSKNRDIILLNFINYLGFKLWKEWKGKLLG